MRPATGTPDDVTAGAAEAVPEVTSSPRRRLLLVEDSRIFADLLADRIRGEPGVAEVSVACSLSEARANLRRARPDLVMLDLHLGEELGTDLLAELRLLDPPPRVLMLSGTDSARQVVDALRAGADGWVAKTADFGVLMLAADEVLQGNMFLAQPAVGPVLRFLLDRDVAGRTFVDGLSPRQLEVLRCIVAGMSRAEAAERLHISVNTVRTHVQVLLRRADVHTTLELAALARDLGVTGVDEDPGAGAPRLPGSRT